MFAELLGEAERPALTAPLESPDALTELLLTALLLPLTGSEARTMRGRIGGAGALDGAGEMLEPLRELSRSAMLLLLTGTWDGAKLFQIGRNTRPADFSCFRAPRSPNSAWRRAILGEFGPSPARGPAALPESAARRISDMLGHRSAAVEFSAFLVPKIAWIRCGGQRPWATLNSEIRGEMFTGEVENRRGWLRLHNPVLNARSADFVIREHPHSSTDIGKTVLTSVLTIPMFRPQIARKPCIYQHWSGWRESNPRMQLGKLPV
jgi:hypothetical protein